MALLTKRAVLTVMSPKPPQQGSFWLKLPAAESRSGLFYPGSKQPLGLDT